MEKNYKNLVFTKHAHERLQDRKLTKEAIYQTVNFPNYKKKGKDDSFKFIKTVKNRNTHVVATYLPKEKKWLVISAWVRGEDDKQPLVWRLITLPFKIVWKLLNIFLGFLYK